MEFRGYEPYQPPAEAPAQPTASTTRTILWPMLAMGIAAGFALGLIFASPLGWSSNGGGSLYDEDLVTELFEQAAPAVVEINVSRDRAGRIPAVGSGSGFLIDAEGHIITNQHVVSVADDLYVRFADGREVAAKRLGTSAADDLAVLKVDAAEVQGIEPLVLADSSDVRAGELAVAIGSPFRQFNSITIGIVSGTGRGPASILRRPIPDMIQTDAALNPGNSGGPLLNAEGDAIGVASAVRTPDMGNSLADFRIGFAVPSNTVRDLLPRLMSGEDVRRPWIGIAGGDVTKELSDARGLPRGIMLTQVVVPSPASLAGLDAFRTVSAQDRGDVITAIDGTPVESMEDMVSYLNGKAPGDEIELSVFRDRKTIEISLILDPWPN
ncbi:MAG: PDZ domain-containing protein [SAR202 cluster bacterium]|nr:trypsin-like peptidase domain-containing protein [SAR202 cluster bacterium]MDP6663872.1 trypsin-like peptidase domain-containing protein [SAR202 cluster bacterium]MDP6799647.1 trypsin-like peptidase domain-containing protein [SAR202 cluster bacterium]MQG68763.1 PDZ domain-containing protein [SAR202 cluster bacterium]HAL49153.1 trypsin [Dehalococcoidia bacterium]